MENRNDILNELEMLSPAIAAMEKVNVFTVPQGYFEHLSADMMTGIETENGSIKTPSLAGDVPVGYFDNLAGSILAKIKTQQPADAAAEIRALSPMLYSIQNEKVYEVPTGYFEGLMEAVLNAVNPPVQVVNMKRRTAVFFKYAVAAAFTGMMAIGVFKFTGNPAEHLELPGYVTDGLKVQDVDQELDNIEDAEIVKFLEANGTDVKTAMVAGSIDENELPSQEDYLMDDKALDKYLNTIYIDEPKK
jgi:hypothetical protein